MIIDREEHVFPTVTKTYKKALFVQAGAESHLFRDSNIVLPVCMGQSYHDSEKLSALLQLVESRFKHVTIVICDALNRHTLACQSAYQIDSQTFFEKSIQMGDHWVSSNHSILCSLKMPHNIMRWSDFILTDEFKSRRSEIRELYYMDNDFRMAFDNTVNLFVTRNFSNHEERVLAESKSLEYVIEECAVMSLWVKLNVNYEVYPGDRIPAMIATHQKFVRPKFPGLLKWIKVRYKTVTGYRRIRID